MYTVLGIGPDDARPSSEPLVRRLQPEDRTRTLEAIAGACSGRAFALEVHTAGPDGAVKSVLLVGEPETAPDGGAVAVDGLCVDLTETRSPAAEDERVRALQTEVSQLRTAMASRASIEQAKGILMLLTNCGEQSAFDLLAHISSHTHRKVREVAQDITESATGRSKLPDDIRAILRDACPPTPS